MTKLSLVTNRMLAGFCLAALVFFVVFGWHCGWVAGNRADENLPLEWYDKGWKISLLMVGLLVALGVRFLIVAQRQTLIARQLSRP